MTFKSTWISAALIGVVGFTPVTADAQIRQSTTIENLTSAARQRAVMRQREAARQRAEAQRAEARRGGSIFDRDDDSDGNRKRSCAKLSRNDKERCKQLRKEEHRLAKLEKRREHRLAKLEKRREHCLAKHQSNPSHPHCDGMNGRASVRDRLPDVIYGGDVRRPRGTDPASGVLGRLPRSGL